MPYLCHFCHFLKSHEDRCCDKINYVLKVLQILILKGSNTRNSARSKMTLLKVFFERAEAGKQTTLLACEIRKAFRFLVLTETKRCTESVRFEKCTHGLTPPQIKITLFERSIF